MAQKGNMSNDAFAQNLEEALMESPVSSSVQCSSVDLAFLSAPSTMSPASVSPLSVSSSSPSPGPSMSPCYSPAYSPSPAAWSPPASYSPTSYSPPHPGSMSPLLEWGPSAAPSSPARKLKRRRSNTNSSKIKQPSSSSARNEAPVSSVSSLNIGAPVKAPEKITSFSASSLTRRSLLLELPMDLSLRCLTFLSVSDLNSSGLTCRTFQEYSTNSCVWSGLYVQRWPAEREQVDDDASQSKKWKQQYKERDVQEQEEFMKGVLDQDDPELLHYFRQMKKAKTGSMVSRSRNEFTIIDNWKQSHPYLEKKDDSTHDCRDQACTFYKNGNVSICEQSGKVHFCSKLCDFSSCPISDRWTHSEAREDLEFENDDANEPDERSFFAKCYEFGYNSVSLDEASLAPNRVTGPDYF